MEAAQKTVKERKEYVVGIDLERFFDRIHHDRLINQMKLQISDKRILRLTGMLLRSEIMKDGLVRAMRVLCKQVHLARLSNVVLDDLDEDQPKRKVSLSRGVKFLGMTISDSSNFSYEEST